MKNWQDFGEKSKLFCVLQSKYLVYLFYTFVSGSVVTTFCVFTKRFLEFFRKWKSKGRKEKDLKEIEMMMTQIKHVEWGKKWKEEGWRQGEEPGGVDVESAFIDYSYNKLVPHYLFIPMYYLIVTILCFDHGKQSIKLQKVYYCSSFILNKKVILQHNLFFDCLICGYFQPQEGSVSLENCTFGIKSNMDKNKMKIIYSVIGIYLQ